jgi:heme/copper-type cytochrome/quinol oxidase subunit 3
MGLFTFLLSLVTMHWSVYAVRNNDRQHAILALVITILFGICAINSVTFLYTQSHIGVSGSATGVLFYVITGAHIAMTVAALVFAALMTFRTLGGNYAGRDHDGILAASLFWYATVAVYAVMWYAIFVNK